ncbi:hypothetical protein [Streptomyces sp. NPDC059165]|uniref:hypothetical protein n=1 Tax=Streptomyces sp. NPDC059165 TaxID=3346751 RepID=UPI0036B2F73E
MTLFHITEIRYELAAERELPEGRLVHVTETAGLAVVQLHERHVHDPRLAEQLTEFSRPIHEYGRWAQDWTEGADPHRTEKPAEGSLARAWWEFWPAHEMPDGDACRPFERPGEMFWAIREGAISDELLAEMNGVLQRVVGDGLWKQQSWE